MLLKAKEIILLLSGEEGARFSRVITTVKKKNKKQLFDESDWFYLCGLITPHLNNRCSFHFHLKKFISL